MEAVIDTHVMKDPFLWAVMASHDHKIPVCTSAFCEIALKWILLYFTEDQ